VNRFNFANEAEWLAWRTGKITATDAATICGANPYKSRFTLYHEKLGLVPRSETGEPARWGNLLEATVRKEYALRTNQKVRTFAPYTTFTHSKLDWMAATPDGVIVPRGLYEGKTCSAYKEKEWDDGPPLQYMFQIQHEMEVFDYEWTGIACLVGGQKLVDHVVKRDRVFGQNLVNEEFAFLGMLANRTVPAVDGSDSTVACLAAVYNKPTPTKVDLPDHFLSLYRARQDALAIADAKKDTAAEVDNAIKAFMGNNEEAYLPSGEKFTWKADKNGKRVFRAPK
jgi:putative phage-type endonuclease